MRLKGEMLDKLTEKFCDLTKHGSFILYGGNPPASSDEPITDECVTLLELPILSRESHDGWIKFRLSPSKVRYSGTVSFARLNDASGAAVVQLTAKELPLLSPMLTVGQIAPEEMRRLVLRVAS
jgi:hypothetical protein